MLALTILVLVTVAALALLATVSPVIRGTSTTIRWGVKGDGANGGGLGVPGGMSGAIVTKLSHEVLGGPPVIIEDDQGFAAIWVKLIDGDKLTLTCIDDKLSTWPEIGDWCSFKVPRQNATNNNFKCEDNNCQLARKEPGTRGLVVTYHPNITQ